MTFSIVACDLEEQAWGVAVASKFPAVGAVVPWAQAEAGAVATQSFANTSFGPRGLAMMAAGLSAQETLARLLEDDPDRELRQVGLVDAKGGSATFTGSGCFAWAGGVSGSGYAIQGNILKSGRVVPAMEKAFLKTKAACRSGSMRLCWQATVQAATNADDSPRRCMWSSRRVDMAASWTVGSTTAWMTMWTRYLVLANCSTCTSCTSAKAPNLTAPRSKGKP